MRGLLVLVLCALTGCESEAETAQLRGSLAQVYSLDFQAVRARLDDRELAIQYVDGGQVPVQVIVRVTESPLAGPGTVDLTRFGAVVGARGPARVPEFVQGTLRLDDYAPTAGAEVAGSFDAIVRAGDQSLTVVGEFSTTLEDIR